MNSFRRFARSRSDQNAGSINSTEGENEDALDSDQETTTAIHERPQGSRSSSEPHVNLSSLSRITLTSSRHGPIPEDPSLSGSHGHRRGQSLVPLGDPLGLSLIHEGVRPLVDFIFVHGLGGTSCRTWSFNHDPQNFWPVWLKDDINLSRSRLFVFGYNADFAGKKTPLNVLDFAKDLLFRLKTYASVDSPRDTSIGQYPIVFVMHSLGGLVVKMAYIIGKLDNQYSGIIEQIRGMLFLGTPHRGSDLAETLNLILRSTPGASSKTYVSELNKHSESLQSINEQFRNICPNIDIVSLYETRRTSLIFGMRKQLVEKGSAILGYATEHSSGLDADHHGMCKFASTSDTNYLHVRNVLNMLWQKNKPSEPDRLPLTDQSLRTSLEVMQRLEALFGITTDAAEDLDAAQEKLISGSCQWILSKQSFRAWMDLNDSRSRAFWLTGLPGSGKSVLSGFITDHLQKESSIRHCCYHFFRAEHHAKRSVGFMLRSIALQLAMADEAFQARLLDLCEAGISLTNQKPAAIWDAIFESILLCQPLSRPVFWLLDGLDEADQPDLLMRLLSRIQSTNTFRIFIASRMFRDAPSRLSTVTTMPFVREEIHPNDTLYDIWQYASSVISVIVHTQEAQNELCEKIYTRANGSFLWVKLALEQLKDHWHTHSDIERILNDMPEGMEELYIRMIGVISEQALRPRTIALRILTWMVCANRPLELSELEFVLTSEFGEFVSFGDTVLEVCANFVVIERSRLLLIHETARHFLLHKTSKLPISIAGRSGHEHVVRACLNLLMDPSHNWRRALHLAQIRTDSLSSRREHGATRLSETHPFLTYAIIHWPFHVSQATKTEDLSALTLSFLENSCLVWINAVALLGEMRDITKSAQYLKLFLRRKPGEAPGEALTSLRQARDDEIRQWAKDLVRVVGRFGKIIMENPQSIYRSVVPFCPTDSMIGRTYTHPTKGNPLSVRGLSSKGWDDCMARLSMLDDEYPTKIACVGPYFVALVGLGTVIVWYADSCAEARRLKHSEMVTIIEPCNGPYWLATADTKTVRVWDLNTGHEIFNVPKLLPRNIIGLSFGKHNCELRIGYDDAEIQCFSMDNSTMKWEMLAEDGTNNDHVCPHLISFSPEGSQVVLAYRGLPAIAWSLDSRSQPPQRCVRPEDKQNRNQESLRAVTPEVVQWLREKPTVLILYVETTIVEWNIEDDSQRELPITGAREMIVSPEGNLLLTSDCTGALSLWTIPEYRLTYRLHMEDSVRGLAFSPNEQRFYDIRDRYCNVWEPDLLASSEDLEYDELSSTQITSASEPVSSTSELRPLITAVLGDDANEYYCAGKDSGAVVLYEVKSGEKIRKLYGHDSIASVTQLAWSKSRTYIASADDCGRVLVKRLRPPSGGNTKWAVYGLLDFSPGESITQLLFDGAEEHLLVATTINTVIWNLKQRQKICQTESRIGKHGKWAAHPSDPNTVLQINLPDVRFFAFASLEEKTTQGTRRDPEGKLNEDGQTEIPVHLCLPTSDVVDVIGRTVAFDQSRVLLEVFPGTGTDEVALSRRRAILLDTSRQQPPKAQVIDALTGQYRCILGVFQDQLVFLSRDFAFCTLDLAAVDDGFKISIKKHFHLPNDWLSTETLNSCTMNTAGTILCPRNGEIAVIQGGIREQ